MLRNLFFAVIGTAAMLAYWTIEDRLFGGASSGTELDAFPAVYVGGGAGKFEISVFANQPAELYYHLSRGPDADEDGQYGRERFEAGRHKFSTDLAPGTFPYLELKVLDPQPGAKMTLTVRFKGKRLYSRRAKLDKPLEKGYGFFLLFETERALAMR